MHGLRCCNAWLPVTGPCEQRAEQQQVTVSSLTQQCSQQCSTASQQRRLSCAVKSAMRAPPCAALPPSLPCSNMQHSATGSVVPPCITPKQHPKRTPKLKFRGSETQPVNAPAQRHTHPVQQTLPRWDALPCRPAHHHTADQDHLQGTAHGAFSSTMPGIKCSAKAHHNCRQSLLS